MSEIVQGLQLFTVRNALKADELGTIRAIRDIGYTNVEANDPGFIDGRIAPVRPAEQTRAIYADMGVKVITVSMGIDRHASIDEWKQLVEYSCRIGSKAVVCGVGTFRNRDQLLERADFFNRVGEFAKENGQEFYYHNHFQEFMNLEGERIIDVLLRHTETELVGIELDVFWVMRSGQDPIECMKALDGRLKAVHLKDLSAQVSPCILDRIPHGLEIGWDEFLKYSHEPEAFVEMGKGCVNLQGIAGQIKRMPGVWAAIVEQDATSIGELNSARADLNYLRTLF